MAFSQYLEPAQGGVYGYVRQLQKVKLSHQDISGPLNAFGPTPLECKGHCFPEITAGHFPSYTALSA